MNKRFSISWKKSKQPRKQRKYRYNAPLHIKTKFLSAHLSKELKKKYGKRNVTVKKGDKVKILRGSFKGRTGSIERVNVKKTKVYVTGAETVKKDGSKTFYPINPSNIIITELESEDKKRIKTMERVKK